MTELSRPDPARYSRAVAWSAADGEFVALCPEFPGLSGVGVSPSEALAALDEAIGMAIEIAEEDGDPLPTPRELAEHSGQFRLRVPRFLHAGLAAGAQESGMSLNTFVVALLSNRMGELTGYARARNEMRADLRTIAGVAVQAAAQQVSAVVRASIGTAGFRPAAPIQERPQVTAYGTGTAPTVDVYAVGH